MRTIRYSNSNSWILNRKKNSNARSVRGVATVYKKFADETVQGLMAAERARWSDRLHRAGPLSVPSDPEDHQTHQESFHRTKSVRPPAVRVPSDDSHSPLGRRRRPSTPFVDLTDTEMGSPNKRRNTSSKSDDDEPHDFTRSIQAAPPHGRLQRSHSFSAVASAATTSFARRGSNASTLAGTTGAGALTMLKKGMRRVSKRLQGPQRAGWIAAEQRRMSESASTAQMEATAAEDVERQRR